MKKFSVFFMFLVLLVIQVINLGCDQRNGQAAVTARTISDNSENDKFNYKELLI